MGVCELFGIFHGKNENFYCDAAVEHIVLQQNNFSSVYLPHKHIFCAITLIDFRKKVFFDPPYYILYWNYIE